MENNLRSILRGLNERLSNYLCLAEFSSLKEGLGMADSNSYRAATSYTVEIGNYSRRAGKILLDNDRINNAITTTPGVYEYFRELQAEVYKTEMLLAKCLKVISGMDQNSEDYTAAVKMLGNAINILKEICRLWDDAVKARKNFLEENPDKDEEGWEEWPELKSDDGTELSPDNKDAWDFTNWINRLRGLESKINSKEDPSTVMSWLSSLYQPHIQ